VELVVLPPEFRRAEIEWPFTESGKYLDDALKQKGFQLINKVVSNEEGLLTFKLSRNYASGNRTVLYDRAIPLPVHLQNGRFEYEEFHAEDITWDINDNPQIPLSVLRRHLASVSSGVEQFILEEDAFYVDILVAKQDDERTIRLATQSEEGRSDRKSVV